MTTVIKFPTRVPQSHLLKAIVLTAQAKGLATGWVTKGRKNRVEALHISGIHLIAECST